jgi:hypothetical protein
MNGHYRTLAEYILREITLQQNHSQTFMQKVKQRKEFIHQSFICIFYSMRMQLF